MVNVLPVRLETVQADRSTALLRLRVGGAVRDGLGGGLGYRSGNGSGGGLRAPFDRALGQAAGASPVWLLARITRRSAEALALQPGDALFAQIKGVALM